MDRRSAIGLAVRLTAAAGLIALRAGTPAGAAGTREGTTTIIGTSLWDVETNHQGGPRLPGADLWLDQVRPGTSVLVPMGTAALATVPPSLGFDPITRSDLQPLSYSQSRVDVSTAQAGRVLALRTTEGHLAKLQILQSQPVQAEPAKPLSPSRGDSTTPTMRGFLKVHWVLWLVADSSPARRPSG
jgi:hypothetical protein